MNKVVFLKNFLGRIDVLAEGYNDKGGVGYCPKKVPKGHIDSFLQRHLDGEKIYGTYLIDAENKVWFCVIDVDDPNDLDKAKRIYQDIRAKLQFKLNVPCLAEFSGRKGYHIWIFFKDRISAEKAENFGKIITHYCGYPHLEVFPKQGSVTKDKPYGNLIKLPLGIHPKDRDKKSKIRISDTLKRIDTSLVDSICESYKELLEPKVKPEDFKNKTNLCITKMLEEGVVEGERNEAIGILTAHFRQAGLSKDMVIKNLEEWRQKSNPPPSQDVVIERVESIFSRELSPWSCSSISAGKLGRFCFQDDCIKKPKEGYTNGEGHYPISIQSVDQLVKENQNEQIWLIHKLVPVQSVTFICGYPKSFKTWFALDLAVSLSRGGRFLGYRVRKSKVVYWQQELSNATISDRFRMMCRGEPNGNLYHVPFTGRGLMNLLNPKHQDMIEKFIQTNRPDVIVIDPLVQFLGSCDENSNTNIQSITNFCNSMKVNYGVSWIIIHHARKSYDFKDGTDRRVSLNSLRGASSLGGWGDAYFFLNNPKVNPLVTVEIDFTLRHAEALPMMRLILNRKTHRFKLRMTTEVIISYVKTRKSVSGREVKNAFRKWRDEKYVAKCLQEGVEMGELTAKPGRNNETIYEYKFFDDKDMGEDETALYE